MNKPRKTDQNHKASYLFGVLCKCSCGWESCTWYGKGAKHNATGEWHMHRDKCDKAADEVLK